MYIQIFACYLIKVIFSTIVPAWFWASRGTQKSQALWLQEAHSGCPVPSSQSDHRRCCGSKRSGFENRWPLDNVERQISGQERWPDFRLWARSCCQGLVVPRTPPSSSFSSCLFRAYKFVYLYLNFLWLISCFLLLSNNNCSSQSLSHITPRCFLHVA